MQGQPDGASARMGRLLMPKNSVRGRTPVPGQLRVAPSVPGTIRSVDVGMKNDRSTAEPACDDRYTTGQRDCVCGDVWTRPLSAQKGVARFCLPKLPPSSLFRLAAINHADVWFTTGASAWFVCVSCRLSAPTKTPPAT